MPILSESEQLVILRATELSDWGVGTFPCRLPAAADRLTEQKMFFASQYENSMIINGGPSVNTFPQMPSVLSWWTTSPWRVLLSIDIHNNEDGFS